MIPALNFVVLTNALHALKKGNIHHCEALGFTYDELNAINELSLDELFALSRASAQFMNITIHHENLRPPPVTGDLAPAGTNPDTG